MKTNNERQRSYVKRMKNNGYVILRSWVKKENKDKLNQIIKSMEESGEKL